MSLSLDGVRVLELARYQAGPRGGMIMSDLGAEVIKIETYRRRGNAASNPPWCAARASISPSTTAARKASAWTCATARQGDLHRTGQDRRHRAGEFPPRHDGRDGLRLRRV